MSRRMSHRARSRRQLATITAAIAVEMAMAATADLVVAAVAKMAKVNLEAPIGQTIAANSTLSRGGIGMQSECCS